MARGWAPGTHREKPEKLSCENPASPRPLWPQLGSAGWDQGKGCPCRGSFPKTWRPFWKQGEAQILIPVL